MRTCRLAVPGAVLVGAALLSWPALLNGYPLVFSDTWGYIDQGYEGVSWDKPWIYGPLIRAFHWGVSLWPVVPAQAVLVSTLLWLALDTTSRAGKAGSSPAFRHGVLCAALALVSAAPWFVGLAMPDILTPLVPLSLFALAYAPLSRSARIAMLALATLLIAAHFSHVPMAAACVATLAGLRWAAWGWRTVLRGTWRPAAAFGAALLLLFGTNLVGRHQATLSPTGSVFLLARLTADGPAAAYLGTACPSAGYHLCNWKDRFPTDSDAFLWAADGPVYDAGYGADRLAPEAGRIIRQTLLAHPGWVAATALRNTLAQLGMVRLGDTLAADHLDSVLRDTIIERFPPAELSRYEASRQYRSLLRPVGDTLNPVLLTALALGGLSTLVIAATAWRTRPALAALAVLVLAAVLANAFATGALSGPHDRYEARIAWLVLLPPLIVLIGWVPTHRTPGRRPTPRPRPAPRPPPPAASRSSAG